MKYEVTQQQANEILYKACEAWDMFRSLEGIDGMRETAYSYKKAAQAYYECWTAIVGYEFTNGIWELDNICAEDFEEVMRNSKSQELIDQFQDYTGLFV